MFQTKPKRRRGDSFLLEAVDYLPEVGRIRVRFRNNDLGEAPVDALWLGRTGRPDWAGVRIDPENPGALLVPTLPGHPTAEGPVGGNTWGRLAGGD